MYLIDVLRVLRRRWYVLAVCLLVVIGAALATVKVVKPTYQASGEMLLLLPADASGKATPLNPFLNLQAGVSVVASLVAGKLTTDDMNKEMVAAGYSQDYTVEPSPNIGALLEITVKDEDADRALLTRNELVKRAATQIRTIQASLSVPGNQVIEVGITNTSKNAERLSGSKVRALAVVVGGGVVGTLLLVFGLDRLLLRRRDTKVSSAHQATSAEVRTRGDGAGIIPVDPGGLEPYSPAAAGIAASNGHPSEEATMARQSKVMSGTAGRRAQLRVAATGDAGFAAVEVTADKRPLRRVEGDGPTVLRRPPGELADPPVFESDAPVSFKSQRLGLRRNHVTEWPSTRSSDGS